MSRSRFTSPVLPFLVLAALCMAGTAGADGHEKLLQVVTVRVEAGELDEYLEQIEKLSAVQKRVGSRGVTRVWTATQGGSDAGQILVAIEYPNEATWAADWPKVQNDSKWQDILGDLPKIRTLEGSSLWRELSPNPPADVMKPRPGTILLVTGVAVKPGMMDKYIGKLGMGQAIIDRLKLGGRMRVWHAAVAGPDTGNVAVGVEYPSLAAYVSDQAKLRADADWRKLIDGLDDLRSLGGRWLYREITP